jgi:hypothetical protein
MNIDILTEKEGESVIIGRLPNNDIGLMHQRGNNELKQAK